MRYKLVYDKIADCWYATKKKNLRSNMLNKDLKKAVKRLTSNNGITWYENLRSV